MKNLEPCQFLEWDSTFFGVRIGQILKNSLDTETVRQIDKWSKNYRVDCLYLVTDADDSSTIRLAEDNGFHQVEIRILYESNLTGWDPDARQKSNQDVVIRNVRNTDIPQLQQIAKNSYQNSRWYFDPCFPEEKCQEFYQSWIKKSAEGGASFVLVADIDGEILGYISGNRQADHPEGSFELTAVKETSRRSGIGHELFASSLDWYIQHSVNRVIVNTQGRNLGTQRMIMRFGFLPFKVHLFYHRWMTDCAGKFP